MRLDPSEVRMGNSISIDIYVRKALFVDGSNELLMSEFTRRNAKNANDRISTPAAMFLWPS